MGDSYHSNSDEDIESEDSREMNGAYNTPEINGAYNTPMCEIAEELD